MIGKGVVALLNVRVVVKEELGGRAVVHVRPTQNSRGAVLALGKEVALQVVKPQGSPDLSGKTVLFPRVLSATKLPCGNIHPILKVLDIVEVPHHNQEREAMRGQKVADPGEGLQPERGLQRGIMDHKRELTLRTGKKQSSTAPRLDLLPIRVPVIRKVVPEEGSPKDKADARGVMTRMERPESDELRGPTITVG